MNRILRAGLYERVSTEEQALRGYSIRAQKENLEEYCITNKLKIVDHYSDEGISGSKPPLKRPDLQRLLDDVQSGNIDIILFTKLDRWFRSVKEYFKVQEILDKYKVEWRAINENYDTTTANGQMAITIFLAVAQNERDRTSERIKTVIDNKIKNKEACWGNHSVPLGYMKQMDENGIMRLVKDPNIEPYMNEFWRILLETNNKRKAIEYMHSNGIIRDYKTWYSLTKNDFYYGSHRNVDNFCEPYITKEQYDKYHSLRPIKSTPKGRIYIFSSLLRCPLCGLRMYGGATVKKKTGIAYKYYRCRNRSIKCEYTKAISEKKVENLLLNNLKNYIEDSLLEITIEQSNNEKDYSNMIKNIKEKRRRLEIIYMAGNKTDEEYLKEDAILKSELAIMESKNDTKPKNIDMMKKILDTDFNTVYVDLTEQEKRVFWRNILKEVTINDGNIENIIFFD